MVKKKLPKRAQGFVPARVLQNTAKVMYPFYRAIAFHKRYADGWSKAVISPDLDKMVRLLTKVSPRAKGLSLGSNGIGYFIGFPVKNPYLEFSNGTTVIPGTAQFTFDPRIHQAIARAVLPFYYKLAKDRSFAVSLSNAVRSGNEKVVRCLIRSFVRTPALISVKMDLDGPGISLNFKYKSSKFIYRNLLFIDQA
ncbi:hypothetical protein J45TS6_38760 [Paenibacillus sp. J45TS6]|uniref:hypothetical protein n=1 Tax=Paenibacillus sp. J45TS6 TaxID=2807196 RepID=UPI001B06891E|nr:hypothetical protein [Paenibacillus sp. J45TS6]GIP45417.1 hypothetical protein J45TS6_38760 [Paenibacillus sp. J45TS6]